MVGLSYGGFYTMYLAAVDTRIRSCVASSFMADNEAQRRDTNPMIDWGWKGIASRLWDGEVGSMICPRRFCLQLGKGDTGQNAHRKSHFARIRHTYSSLGVAEQLRLHVFDGGHELDRNDADLDFMLAGLGE